MDYSIIYIAPTLQQGKRIRNVLKRMNLDFPVFETYGHYAVAIAKQMIEKHDTRVIISRGGTLALLNKEIDIPTVDIRHTFIDIWLSMQKAQKMSNRIAIVGYHHMCKAASLYKEIMNQPIEVITVNSDDEFYDVVAALKARGIELIIGGLQATNAAKELNLLYVHGEADENAIELATNEALNILRIENERIERFKTLQAIINYTIEGIVHVDRQGSIIHINNNARHILKYREGMSLMSLIPDKCINDTLTNGAVHTNHMTEINGISVIINSIPIIVKDTLTGAVITIQKEDDVLSLDQKIKRKNAARGYIAKKTFSDIVGKSVTINNLKQKAMQYALSDSTITIYGETGTGKEVLAQSIHNYSPRAPYPFVAINCAALPESILESELFGYVSGAFTGARREGRAGIFELANRGTVFLDEISELSLNVQAKFLRVLQEKEISRIGDDRIIKVDVRVIVASNKRLIDAVESGSFRADLYYRLCVLELEIPPLRSRKEDIPLLAKHFLKELSGSNYVEFDEDALDLLCTQNWPGNVRQLSNIIERIWAINHTTKITRQQVEDALGYDLKRGNNNMMSKTTKTFNSLFDEAQIELINKALKQTNGNRTKAAEILSISTSTLWRKMKKFGLIQ